jgi:hypothetical protein
MRNFWEMTLWGPVQPRVASVETIAGFQDEGKSVFVKPAQKTILHKGEVCP